MMLCSKIFVVYIIFIKIKDTQLHANNKYNGIIDQITKKSLVIYNRT